MWITPKTNWTSKDNINATDFNRISGNITEINNEIYNILYEHVTVPTEFVQTWEQYGIPLKNECDAIIEYLNNINNKVAVSEVIPTLFKYNYVELNQIETFLNAEHTWYLEQTAQRNKDEQAYTTEIYSSERGYM